MTEIERKALALVNEVQAERNHTGSPWNSPTILSEALDRAIERHEAFRQEVSDAVEQYWASLSGAFVAKPPPYMARFILPKPVDPLVEALKEAAPKSREMTHEEVAQDLRTAMQARGYEWRKIGEGE